jgi:PAP2 superfamily
MPNIFQKLKDHWNNQRTYDRFLVIISLVYFGIIGAFLVLHQAPYSPDQFYYFALVFVLLTGQAWSFIKDWTAPILLLLSYEFLRSIIPKINPTVHYFFMIRFDQFIFGTLPTVSLQRWLFNPNYLHWYDYLCAFLYEIHFVVVLFVAFILWLTSRKDFETYIFGMVILSYMAFFTYLAYPAAPPWLASQYGFISPVTHITNIVFSHYLGFMALPTVYKYFGENLVAAVPSLHAGYPFFTALFLGRKYPRLIPFLALYIGAVGFAVIYLGEHYFFDVILGMAYAFVAYLIVEHRQAIMAKVRSVRTVQ